MGNSRLKEFLNGYILVRVEGLNPEKFINMASKNGIKLWDIQRINFTTIIFKMKYFQYGQMREILQRTGSKSRILKKYGMHFVYKRMNRRKFFICGIAVFLFIILYLSSIIWKIEIAGNKQVDAQKIYEAAKKVGLKEGTLKYNINLRSVEDSILKDIKELSIVNIKLQGTKAEIEVVERKMPPSIVAFEKPTNIVASKDGIILKIMAYKGKAQVKNGDFVKKGQILISGILTDSQNVPVKVVHAIGDVVAKTWYESIQDVSLNYKYEVRTGRVKKKIFINMFGKKTYIKNDNIDFTKYDKIEEKKSLKIKEYETPIEIVAEYYYEKVDAYKSIDYDEAVKIALDKADSDIKGAMPAGLKIIDKKVEKEIGNGRVKIRVLYITEENICLEQDIK